MKEKYATTQQLFYLTVALFFLFSGTAAANRVAILTPESSARAEIVAAKFSEAFREKFTVIDLSMAEAAFNSAKPEYPFNMTAGEAKAAAAVIGCDTLVLLKTETLRRTSLERPEYYESFLAVYAVDGRSGQLIMWELASFEEPNATAVEKRILDSAPSLARSTAERLPGVRGRASGSHLRPEMEEISADAADTNLKPPIPYKRIRPEYTKTAYLYGIRATVEAEADIDETGRISRTAIVRWAGYGLDDAVIQAIVSMNWRPAMRGGRPLPMRVLLRYNFKKVEKE